MPKTPLSLYPKLKMTSLAEKYKDLNLVSLHSTNPEPFDRIELEQLIGLSFSEMLNEMSLGFSPDLGTHHLRQVIADNLYSNCQASEVITHAGAQEALYCIFQALIQPQVKVLVVTPVYEHLIQMAINMKADVKTLELQSNRNWSLDLNLVENHFKSGCEIIVINFPHNPTGAQLTHNKFHDLIELCRKYDVWLISDEVFRGLEHEQKYRLPAAADVYEKAVSIGVMSKAFAIPGLRVGWLVCQNKPMLEQVLNVKSYLSICNSQVDEKICAFVLQKHEDVLLRNVSIILKNKEYLRSIKTLLEEVITFNIPNAGCSLFATFNCNANKLVDNLAHQKGFMIYPSEVFHYAQSAVRVGFGSKEFIKNISQCF